MVNIEHVYHSSQTPPSDLSISMCAFLSNLRMNGARIFQKDTAENGSELFVLYAACHTSFSNLLALLFVCFCMFSLL